MTIEHQNQADVLVLFLKGKIPVHVISNAFDQLKSEIESEEEQTKCSEVRSRLDMFPLLSNGKWKLL